MRCILLFPVLFVVAIICSYDFAYGSSWRPGDRVVEPRGCWRGARLKRDVRLNRDVCRFPPVHLLASDALALGSRGLDGSEVKGPYPPEGRVLRVSDRSTINPEILLAVKKARTVLLGNLLAEHPKFFEHSDENRNHYLHLLFKSSGRFLRGSFENTLRIVLSAFQDQEELRSYLKAKNRRGESVMSLAHSLRKWPEIEDMIRESLWEEGETDRGGYATFDRRKSCLHVYLPMVAPETC